MSSSEHLYSLALRRCANIGDVNFKKVVAASGSAENAWNSSKSRLKEIFGISSVIVREIGQAEHLRFAENEIKFCERNQIQILLRHQGDFPALLDDCHDAPAILYQKGKINAPFQNLSVVGTRNITTYGKSFVEQLFSSLNGKNINSVSGLALGVDTKVHEESIKNNVPTIAVLAHGFHTLYPAKNRNLSEQILENQGALLTEFTSEDQPDREHFIQRNRIIAGISPQTVVVETAFGGGSVSTVAFANSYNREVFALPGKITDRYSQGCNQLIFQNKASAVSTISGLITELGLDKTAENMESLFPKAEHLPKLSEEQNTIYQLIRNSPSVSLEDLEEQSNWPTHKILSLVLDLEIFGLVKAFSGRRFSIF